MSDLLQPDAWTSLRRYTPARIALGRVGASLSTSEVLDFQMAHARARDAVHRPLDASALAHSLEAANFRTVAVRSEARNREEYVRRPDLGRRLHADSRALLCSQGDLQTPRRLTVIVADGLSSLAAEQHALPLLTEMRNRLVEWRIDSIVIATQARVALADEVGILRGAEAVAILLGERPGLGSPDSLGLYMTYRPRLDASDADRNCISNVRAQGMPYATAAYKLHYLLTESRAAGKSGTSIKDSSVDSSADITAGTLSEQPGPRLHP